MPAEQLVTAPYIQEILHDGAHYFCRLDGGGGGRKLVRATPAVRTLLERFSIPGPADEAGSDGPARAAIKALVDAGFLVGVDGLAVPAPSIELELTNCCDAHCVMCPREDLRPLGRMSEPTFDAVLKLMAAAPVTGVSLQGIGEPTLHPDLTGYVRRLRAVLGAGRPLVLVTNGFRMTPEFLGDLRRAGVDHVQWSFHSLDADRYDRIMGAPAYHRARGNFERCAAEHPDLLSVNFVVLDENAHEQEAMGAWLRGLGLPASRLRPIQCFSRGGFVDASALSRSARRPSAGRCLFVRKSLFVAWNGDVLPCSSDIAGEEVYARLSASTAEDVLARWRDDLLSQPMRFRICRGCDHALRETLETGWFEALRGRPIGAVASGGSPIR